MPTTRDHVADTLVVRSDGAVPIKDGQTYRDSDAKIFKIHNGRPVEVTAFLDLPTSGVALACVTLTLRPEGATQE